MSLILVKVLPKVRSIWWLQPYSYLCFIIVPIYLYSGLTSDLADTMFYYYGCVIIFAFIVGAFLPVTRTLQRTQKASQVRLSGRYLATVQRVLNVLFSLTIFGYVIWFHELLLHPSLLLELFFQDHAFTVRGVVSRTPGLSSMAQLGVVYVILFCINSFVFGVKLRKKFLWYLIVVIVLGTTRAVLWSERLALVEVLVPIVVLFFAFRSRVSAKVIHAIPFLGMFGLYVMFSFMEYFRSWRYYAAYEDNFFLFTLNRLLSYFTTSIYNGIMYNEHLDSVCYSGEHVFSTIYRLPVVGNILTEAFGCSQFVEFLHRHANPEFNLVSWPFYIASDMGVLVTIIVAFILGLFSGWLYANIQKSIFSMLFFPFIYLGLLDFLRQGYMHGARTFYIYLGLFVVYFVLNKYVTLQYKTNEL